MSEEHLHHHTEDQPHEDRGRTGWKWAIALGVFLLIAAFFLFNEHRAHILGFLPYLLLLMCPLVHFFMHGKGGAHSH